MTAAQSPKKQKFSSFNLPRAFKQLDVTQLQVWQISASAIAPSAFFQERLSRLQRVFDLRSYEESKKLLIDAICEEAILKFERLKIWKGAALESDTLIGNVDCLIAENKVYLEAPLPALLKPKKTILSGNWRNVWLKCKPANGKIVSLGTILICQELSPMETPGSFISSQLRGTCLKLCPIA